MTHIDVSDVINSKNLSVEMDVIAIDTIGDSQSSQLDVVVTDGTLYLVLCDAQCADHAFIGCADYFRSGCPANVHHGNRRQLFSALDHHIAGKLAQSCKMITCIDPFLLIFEGNVEIEDLNMCCSGLHYRRTIHLL